MASRALSAAAGNSSSTPARTAGHSSSQEMRETRQRFSSAGVPYDVFARSWPSAQGELADLLNALPKYVVSSTLREPRGGIRRGARRRPGRGGSRKLTREVQGEYRRPRQPPARTDTDRQRPRRRAAPDGVSGRARRRQAAVRADAREQAPPACRVETARPRRRTPSVTYLPATNGETYSGWASCQTRARCRRSLGR